MKEILRKVPEVAEGSETARDTGEVLIVKNLKVSRERKFGGVYCGMPIREFLNTGFAFGDSVDLRFSNGFTLLDIPYYNGFYNGIGEPLLVGYSGEPEIEARLNYGDDLWRLGGFTGSETVTVSLREASKYLEIQKASYITYSDKREDYGSDRVFANFRTLSGGRMKEGTFYRSASPCDNVHRRAPFTDRLLGEAGVSFVLNLADSMEEVREYLREPEFSSSAFERLYRLGRVRAMELSMNFRSKDFAEGLAEGLRATLSSDGPVLIHCTEGKDRTGFVCALLEGLCGASYEEIRCDYMLTYENYYGVSRERDEKRYGAIVKNNLDLMLRFLMEKFAQEKAGKEIRTGWQETLSGCYFEEPARRYLQDAGFTKQELKRLVDMAEGQISLR